MVTHKEMTADEAEELRTLLKELKAESGKPVHQRDLNDFVDDLLADRDFSEDLNARDFMSFLHDIGTDAKHFAQGFVNRRDVEASRLARLSSACHEY